MIEWIVSSSVLILIIMALRYILKGKISLRLQYALWGLVLVRLLLPFHIGSSELSILNILPEHLLQREETISFEREATQEGAFGLLELETLENPEPEAVSKKTVVSGQGNTEAVQVEGNSLDYIKESKAEPYAGEREGIKPSLHAINVQEVLQLVWWIGIAFVGSLLLVVNILFFRKLKKTRREVEILAGELGGSSIVLTKLVENRRIYCTEAMETPCLFGLFRPAIYLTPSAMEQEASMRHVLEHEITHYRHKDYIWAIFRGICLAVHWYNPLVWWAAVLSKEDAELACDEATICRLGEQERVAYGQTLIGMTCRKGGSFMITATTMTGNKRGIKERITLLIKKPKMTGYTLATALVLTVIAVGCTFTEQKEKVLAETTAPTITMCPEKESAKGVTEISTVLPTEDLAVMATVEPETVAVVQERMEEPEAVYFATRSIVYVTRGEDYRYIYYREQEKAKAAFEKAMEHVSKDNGYKTGDESSGMHVVYQGDWWMMTREGALVGEGRVEPEYTKELVAICEEVAVATNRWPLVRPEEICGITSATLHHDGVACITNKEKLEQIEQWLVNSEEILERADCSFTALLTLELENGKQVNITMATDDCGTWMSEGAFYRYASKNEEFFELFEEQKAEDMRKFRLKTYLANAKELDHLTFFLGYARHEKTDMLVELRGVVQENTLTKRQMTGLLRLAKDVDSTCSKEFADVLLTLYQKDVKMFAECWSQAGEESKEKIVLYLADLQNYSEEEVEKSLKEQLEANSEKPQE